MGHHPGGLLRRQRAPGALDDPGTQFQRAYRVTALWASIQAPLHPHRARRAVIGRGTPQDAMVPLPVDFERRHIEIKAGQFVAERFALCRDKEPMKLLCKRLKLLDRLARCSTLTQKVLEL